MRQELRAVGSFGHWSAFAPWGGRANHHGIRYASIARSRLVLAFGLLAIVAVLATTKPVSAAKWFPHPDCKDHCRDPDHTCPSGSCRDVWDECPAGTVQRGEPFQHMDEQDCMATGCKLGGCPDTGRGWVENGKQLCIGYLDCPLCFNETCCRLRARVTCCDMLSCTAVYDDCNVPQQHYLGDPSRNQINRTRIAHTGSTTFPFYASPLVPAGGSCEAVRVWGRCTCDDGRMLPGCDPFNSSTWYDLTTDATANTTTASSNSTANNNTSSSSNSSTANTTASSSSNTATSSPAALLPANLSLTCVVLPPPASTSSPPQAPDSASAAATASASATATATSTSDSGQQHGGQQQPSHSSHSSHGGLVALIVVGCVLLAAVTAGSVLWCCGLLPDLHNLRIRSLTSYEPVFTGQQYVPGLESRSRRGGGGGGADSDIPWARFCAAVADGFRRLRYGKRYRQDAADTAAAAERYRALNSLSARTSRVSGAAAGGSGGGPGGPSSMSYSGAPGKYGHVPARPAQEPNRAARAGLAAYGNTDEEDDVGASEVFTLEDLTSRSVETVPSRRFAGRVGSQPTGHYGGGGGDIALPVSVRASGGEFHPGEGAPVAPARLEQAADQEADAATTASRQRLNQFGDVGGGGGGGSGAVGAMYGKGLHDVIHTRPLALSDDDGGGGAAGGGGGGRMPYGGGAAAGGHDDSDGDLDAPLQLLPTPQTTGHGYRSVTRRGGGPL